MPMQIDFDGARSDINAGSESGVPSSPTSSSIFSSSSSVWPEFFSEDEHSSNFGDSAEPADERSDSDLLRLASKRKYHPTLNGDICDSNGRALPVNAPPLPDLQSHQDWTPFDNKVQFELGNFLYRKAQMSAGDINTLLRLWAESHANCGCHPPFQNHRETYAKIDSIKVGAVPWKSFILKYDGELPESNCPPWMKTEYQVWYHDPRLVIKNIFSNPDFKDGMDYAPYINTDASNSRVYHHFMLGEWAWEQGDRLQAKPKTHGTMLVPVLLGSDKTTTSYYPLYLSIGNVHNNVRQAHHDAVEVIGFLAVTKTSRQFADDIKFHRFWGQLLQSSLATILSSLRPGMTTPEVILCPDGHHRRALYVLGPYMADYPEQAAIASIVNGWCPKCTAEDIGSDAPGGRRSRLHTEYLVRVYELGELWDDYGLVGDIEPFTNEFPGTDIHELIAPNLLHQVVKGVFKDHLVTWVGRYLHIVNTPAQAKKILDEIDYRISLAPPFTGLRHFPIGRNFKQWTGNDSKALMKVYLNAIEGHVPLEIVRTFRTFLKFCYIARQEYITEEALSKLEDALARFHENRIIFETSGVRPDGISLPRQHALVHYPSLIRAFGAPNGLSTSITECQHIRSVKEPWRRSNHNNTLGQVLVTNTRTCKLNALLDPEETAEKLIVDGPSVPTHVKLGKTKVQARSRNLSQLADDAGQPDIKTLILRFLQKENNAEEVDPEDLHESVAVFNSAVAFIHAPSDPSGIGGMCKEFICATQSWRKGVSRFDCMLYKGDTLNPRSMRILQVVRARLFFRFGYCNKLYSCALVHWFRTLENEPDEDTGMWKIEPIFGVDGKPWATVVAVKDLVRAAHILPIFDSTFAEKDLTFDQTLDKFKLFYVNKFVDHDSFSLVS
ncbi:hypothetical protein F5887DRAFT_1063466 [Amanita rubescens]|nr:hypothetical protein F5887DRAFT_1063466 [Amanita rubescens]